jgi:predicted RNA-binding Zn-ribbon protein involved in translation (DUF1610 family)
MVTVGFNTIGFDSQGEPIEGSVPYRVCPRCGYGDWDMVLCPRCGEEE